MDVFLTISAPPLGVPYYRDPDDQSSTSYIDLKLEPHRIEEIPEARQWPSLYRLLMQLDAPVSELMSLGCGVFIYPPPDNSPRAQWGAYSYVGYCFADFGRIADAGEYFPQFFHFTRHYASRENTGANVFFELRETVFIDEKNRGFSIDYCVRSSAQSEELLRGTIAQHFDALSDFLPLMGLTPLLGAASDLG